MVLCWMLSFFVSWLLDVAAQAGGYPGNYLTPKFLDTLTKACRSLLHIGLRSSIGIEWRAAGNNIQARNKTEILSRQVTYALMAMNDARSKYQA